MKEYKITEAAEELKVARTTMAKYIKDGWIKWHYSRDNVIVVYEQDLMRLKEDFYVEHSPYTFTEAAKLLGIKRSQSLGDLADRGKIPTVTLPNGKRVILRKDVVKLEKKLKNRSGAQKIGRLIE